MNKLVLTPSLELELGKRDWWAPSILDLDWVATEMLGPHPQGWVRKGDVHGLIAERKHGALASRLRDEMRILADYTSRIRVATALDTSVSAAAFFHLRFEDGIHPLRDGNGRVGRFLLAAQIQDACKMPAAEFLAQFYAHENAYWRVYAPRNPSSMHELMCDFLHRITGTVPPTLCTPLLYSLDPAFPDHYPIATRAIRNCLLFKKTQVSRQRHPFFRKFE
jgi:hypothetical protein